MYFPKEEYEIRWDNIYKLMDDNGYEAAVVFSRSGGTADRWSNCLYIVNFVSSASGQDYDNNLKTGAGFSAVVLEAGKEPLLIADDEPQNGQVATDHIQWANDLVSCVSKYLRQLANKKVVLVGSDVLPMKYASLLFDAKNDLVVDDRLIDRVRMIKSSLNSLINPQMASNSV